MKTIEESFSEVRNKKSNLADPVCFNQAIYGKGYSFVEIRDAFNKLIRPPDYDPPDKDEILQDCYQKTLVGQN